MTIHFGLIGAGGFGREVMPYVRASISSELHVAEHSITVYFVETWEPRQVTCNGYPLISLANFINLPGDKFFNIAIGDGKIRKQIFDKITNRAQSLPIISQNCMILDANEIAQGAVLCANVMVTSNARIGQFFQGNIYSYIAHDCIIGDYVTFAPGVHCNGNVRVDDYAYIGTGAIIKQGTPEKPTRIGSGAIIGMGAVVTKDVPAGVTVVGNPARPLIKK